MADPKLFVDQRQRLIDAGAAVFGYLDIRKSQELEDAVVIPPQRAKLLARPTSLDRRDDLLVVAFMLPPVGGEIRLQHVDGGRFFGFMIGRFKHHRPLRTNPDRRRLHRAGPGGKPPDAEICG